MNYKVHRGNGGYVFATLTEAVAFANEIQRKTKIVHLITETKCKVTHEYTVKEASAK